METKINEYKVTGIKLSQTDEKPKVYYSYVFARSALKAESQFKKLMRTEEKIKPRNLCIAKTEIVKCEDEEVTVKNFGIKLKYRSARTTHNIYKELRSINRTSAIAKLYSVMAGTHKVRSENIDILDIKEISEEECKRPLTKELNDKDLELRSFKKILKNRAVRVVSVTEKPFY